MQRDMELVRRILLAIEAHADGYAGNLKLEFEGWTAEQVGYHVWMLDQAGLLLAQEITTCGDRSPRSIPTALTWEGHEFIAAAKSESIWKTGTATVLGKVGAVSFELLKAVLVMEAKTLLGLS